MRNPFSLGDVLFKDTYVLLHVATAFGIVRICSHSFFQTIFSTVICVCVCMCVYVCVCARECGCKCNRLFTTSF